MAVTFGLLRLVLGKTLGPEVFSYKITLMAGVLYVALLLMLVAAIEIYKRAYDKR